MTRVWRNRRRRIYQLWRRQPASWRLNIIGNLGGRMAAWRNGEKRK
jgi:hypothetical protein